MAYREDRYEDEKIRQRIRDILEEKIKDRTYKGEAFVGGRKYKQSERAKRDRKQRQYYRRKHELMREYKQRANGYEECCEMCGQSYMNAGKYEKDIKRVKAGLRASKKNPWIKFYKEWLKDNKHIEGKKALQMASKEYKKMKRGYY